MKNANDILESGLLEAYVLGYATEQEQSDAQRYIAQFPEVAVEYTLLQENIEAFAMAHAVTPPADLRGQILGALFPDTTNAASEETSATQVAQQVNEVSQNKSRVFKLLNIASRVAAIVLAILAFNFWQRNEDLKAKNKSLEIKVTELEINSKARETQVASLNEKLDVLVDPSTQKYLLKGNEKASTLKMLAYHNKKSGQTYVQTAELPELPSSQCYQLWAAVDGNLISIAVLNANEGLAQVDFYANAASFNITIEPAGGKDQPTLSNLVASVSV